MRAVQIRDYGELEVLEHVDVEVPDPQPGEVRIKVEYAGLRWATSCSVAAFRPDRGRFRSSVGRRRQARPMRSARE